MSDDADVIRRFIAAWSRIDIDELVGFLSEDVIYHNMPIAPVQGRDTVRQFLAGFAGDWAETQWDLLNLAVAGNVVFTERVDRTVTKGGKEIVLPCCGVFELEGGKIKVWRDYFDMATYTSALA
jgi:limonene-1,2-epoxide hydrolase